MPAPTLPAGVQPPAFKTPFFNSERQIDNEWKRCFLSWQTAISALLAFTQKIGGSQGFFGLDDPDAGEPAFFATAIAPPPPVPNLIVPVVLAGLDSDADSGEPLISVPPGGISSIGGPFTPGSVIFASAAGGLAQDNAKLFWDDTNIALGIGTSSPKYPLQIKSTAAVAGTGTISGSDNTTTITGSGTIFTTQLRVGDLIVAGNNPNTVYIVTAITNDTTISIVSNIVGGFGSSAWTFYRNTLVLTDSAGAEVVKAGASANVGGAGSFITTSCQVDAEGFIIWNTQGGRVQGLRFKERSSGVIRMESTGSQDGQSYIEFTQGNAANIIFNAVLTSCLYAPNAYLAATNSSSNDVRVAVSKSGNGASQIVYFESERYAVNGSQPGIAIQGDTVSFYTRPSTWNQTASGNLGGGTGGTLTLAMDTTGFWTLSTAAAGTKGLIIKGAVAQTANLQEWQNSLATVLASVDASGNLKTTGTLTLTPMTQGSVLFAGASGVVSQDNAKHFWDDTNFRLGIGTAAPGQDIDVVTAASPVIRSKTTSTTGVANFYAEGDTGHQLLFQIFGSASVGNFPGYGIPKADLAVFEAQNTNGSSAFIVGTSQSVPVVFGTGRLEAMRIDSSQRVGVGTTGPTKLFSVGEKFQVDVNGLVPKYNNVATAGWGIPAIYGSGRSTAQTAAVASVATYTVGAADGSFWVSMNILITAFTAGTISGVVTYTSEDGTARSLTLNFSSLAGVLSTTAGAAGAFEGVPLHIRAKASTAITCTTTVSVFTGTYNVEGTITQIS